MKYFEWCIPWAHCLKSQKDKLGGSSYSWSGSSTVIALIFVFHSVVFIESNYNVYKQSNTTLIVTHKTH
jgi:hypothetical protein